jgi:hypothetical protein
MPNIEEQIVESVQRLPDEAAREVLDFAQFLLLREAAREDRDLISAQRRSLNDWENAEDDVWNDAPAV